MRAGKLVQRVPEILSWYLRLSGIISIVAWVSAWLSSTWFDDLQNMWILRWIGYFGWMPSLPWGVMMLLVSTGLRRRKKSAWRITTLLIFLFAAAMALVLAGPLFDPDDPSLRVGAGEWVAGVAYALALALLLAARKEFSALPDRANLRLALTVFGTLVLVSGIIGTTLVYLTDTDRTGSWWSQPMYVLLQTILGAGVTGSTVNVSVPDWVNFILGVVGAGLLVLTMWALFRPARRPALLSVEEELPARKLLAEYGEDDSLGYFALRRDKDVILAPNGRAAIAYRAQGTVCLASGDPLGDPESWGPAIETWLAECRAHSWIPGAVSVGGRAAVEYRRHGLNVLELGDEAILDLSEFNLDGREMRQVRQAVRRVERAGYTIRIRRHAQIPPAEMARIVQRADQWREGETERGFSMALGRLGDPTDGRCVMVEAFDAKGELRGLLSFVPWGRTGLSLDLMRRDREAENGLNEYMVAKLAEGGPGIGVRRVSLNFAMLRTVFERGSQIGAGPVLKLAYKALSLASRFWQLESLYLANAKYHPEWVPRYICFPHGGAGLARVGVAYAVAEGFVPSLNRRRLEQAANTVPSPELVAQIKEIEDNAEALRAPKRRLSEQERVRHAKLAKIEEAGMEAYPLGFDRTDLAADLRARHAGLAADTRTGERAAVAGRIMLSREHGKLVFATLRDESDDIQIMLTLDTLGEEGLRTWRELTDLGDQVGVTGEVVTSRKGELSVLADSWKLTAKSLHPLPDKRSGLSDPETRVRLRAVDLIVNDESRRMLRMRGDAVNAVRDVLRERSYLEVETPILQPIHGGATARPFTTRINAYNMRLYLRIAPELYLKRLLVGGLGKVFEMGRDFRNEGVDATHNPEFTMLEAYEPYGDYDTMAELTRELVLAGTRAALGTSVVTRFGREFDLAEPWQQITVYGSVSKALGEEITTDTPRKTMVRHAARHGIEVAPEWGQGRVVQELYEELVEDHLRMPTFVRDFPAETSPLTRPHRDDDRLAEKWDLIVFGMELGTAYSELIDPVLQRQRLTEQSLLAAGGDPEAMELDEDFLRALEYGMPPAGGMGMGVDRLLIALTGRSIRETIAFPLVRPGR